MFGAGAVTVANSLFSGLFGVNLFALRLTGIVTLLMGFVIGTLPWEKHVRAVSFGVSAGAIAALVGTDYWHHYSRSGGALAVYPMFFAVVVAFTGLTQPRGMATAVAVVSGGALASLLYRGGYGGAAVQCLVVTVPASAVLGEVICRAYGHALRLASLDMRRRLMLETLVQGASRLHDALTADESDAVVVETANAMFTGRDTHLVRAAPGTEPSGDDVCFDQSTRQLVITLRGQVGVLATITTVVDEPDAFVMDGARLFSQQIGGRLEQLRMIRSLTNAATHDVLTGVQNRRGAEAQLEALRPGDAVMILDLDHFKTINDTLGHQVGDRVLAEFGEFLRQATRPSDMVARYGGEEFVVICRSTPPDIARQVADRLLEGWRGRQPLVTFSAGVAVHQPGDTPACTLEHADTALYDAKRAGRDRASMFASMQPASEA